MTTNINLAHPSVGGHQRLLIKVLAVLSSSCKAFVFGVVAELMLCDGCGDGIWDVMRWRSDVVDSLADVSRGSWVLLPSL